LAAVDEEFNDYPKSEEVYYTAMLLLESLLFDDMDPYHISCILLPLLPSPLPPPSSLLPFLSLGEEVDNYSLFIDPIRYDKEILEKYIAAFAKRLSAVQRKKANKV
jgi:hypothetical protein